MRRHIFTFTKSSFVIAVVCTIPWASAGDLDPPPGPITSTMKTMNEVEPRTVLLPPPSGSVATPTATLLMISTPGSYVLGGNLTATGAVPGIVITASHVTLDMNGMILDGDEVGTDGIVISGGSVSVFNGIIRGWIESGVDASGTENNRFMDLTISGFGSAASADDGLHAGDFSTVTRCAISGGYSDPLLQPNGDDAGIQLGDGCVVSQCSVAFQMSVGIRAGTGCTITDCSTSFTAGIGIEATDSCTIRNCTATWNLGGLTIPGTGAIQVGDRCYVVGNTCIGSSVVGGYSIRVNGNGNRIEANNIAARDFGGILVSGTGNLILKNSVTGIAPHYNIGAGNSFGPIINVAGVGDISLLAATQHPWANFSY